MRTLKVFLVGFLLGSLALATPLAQQSIIRLTPNGWLVAPGDTTPLLLGSDGRGFINITSAGVVTFINSATVTLPTTTGSTLTLNGGTVTTSTPVLDMTQTWNNVATTFTGVRLNVTDTNSASNSLLMDLQVAAASKFSVSKGGFASMAGGVSTSTFSATALRITGSLAFLASSNGLLQITDTSAVFGIEINEGTAAPTVTACGTGTITAGSRNVTGQFTATGATACTVTFGSPAWTFTPFCVATEVTAARALFISAASTTAITVSGLTAGDVANYHCIGRY